MSFDKGDMVATQNINNTDHPDTTINTNSKITTGQNINKNMYIKHITVTI